MEFDYEGGGPAKGGRVRLYIDANQVGEGKLPATVPLIFSADEVVDRAAIPVLPSATTRAGNKRLHRDGRLGADRRRRGRRRSLHQRGGAASTSRWRVSEPLVIAGAG